MKLRNKKTGEVVVEINKIGLVWNKYGMPAEIGQYDSIAELCEEWEDAEGINVPIIKDEKICKAVRAWAEANGISGCMCKEEMHCVTFETERGMFISFENADPIPPEGNFTITELCGEEEE